MGALVLGLEDADERIRGACIDGYLNLTQCLNYMDFESKIPRKIVNLVKVNNKLTILWGG